MWVSAVPNSNLLLVSRVSPVAMDMDFRFAITAGANFFVIVGLVIYGYGLFAEYHERGKWAKNITGLLAGLGMLLLALALLLTPGNAAVIAHMAQTKASTALVWISSALLLAAITAFGIITYAKPIRLWHERKIERDLNRGLPKIP
jgi:hypothetical protein